MLSDGISIHALVKRATRCGDVTQLLIKISIHALVKRATVVAFSFPPARAISIHALVKRATLNRLRALVKMYYFNPRPREEGDININIYVFLHSYFNPRPREESDSSTSSDVS